MHHYFCQGKTFGLGSYFDVMNLNAINCGIQLIFLVSKGCNICIASLRKNYNPLFEVVLYNISIRLFNMNIEYLQILSVFGLEVDIYRLAGKNVFGVSHNVIFLYGNAIN